MKKLFLLFAYCLLASCATTTLQTPINPMRKLDDIQRVMDYASTPFIRHPQPNHYSICHNNGCAEFSFISLNHQQWSAIDSYFSPLATTAQQEREYIKSAIALLETYSGEQSITSLDRAENSLTISKRGQLDCIDEATNTTVYLRMIAGSGLLKFHQQASRRSRGGLIIPHNTATIVETSSKQLYAVDSWFGANGEPPHIISLKEWKKGWTPEQY